MKSSNQRCNMPNRILKESICTSDNLNKASPLEESLFFRLIVNCDDYGRMDARPPVIRARCFPLRIDEITDKEITERLNRLQELNLLKLYTVENQPYLHLVTWEKQQQVRAQRSKYPPPSNGSGHLQMISDDNTGNQMKSTEIKSPRNPILSVSLSESLSYKELPDFINQNTWISFIEMRKKIKAMPTIKAQELIIEKLSRLKDEGQEPNKVLEQSIMNGWKGVFSVKDDKKIVATIPPKSIYPRLSK